MIEIGIKGRQDAVVQENMLSTNVGSGCVKVFATPMMIALMEKTATLSVEPFLEEGQSTVGTLVNVGMGRTSVQRFGEIMASLDRNQAGATAPARGLYLYKVNY